MKARILVIEDEIAINDLLCMNLEVTGYETVSCLDGNEASDTIRQDHNFQCALVDIMLPGKDGYALLPELKRFGIPVIFLTAKADLSSKVKGLKEGAEDYIVKPFEMLEVMVRLEKVLERHGSTQEQLQIDDVIIDTVSHTVTKNGEEIYLKYTQGWFNPGKFSVPATTDVVTVSNDGKTLTYKGEYVDNNIICLGDVQKSAINNLNIIMNSNMMQRRYGVEVKDYSTALGNLKAYQSVTKDSVQKASANVESLNKVIAMVEDLNASDYTKASWAAVEEALNAAKAVAAKADATVIETTNAMTDLLAAMNSLEQGVEKIHLEISIKEAEKVLVRADKYSSLGNLEEAVANGKAVLANEDADQETVDAAATAILNELSKAVKNADLSSLESLIKSAKKLQDGNYTSNSLAKLDEVIKAAEAVVANKNRTVEEVNKAYSDLIDAVISLEKKGNKAALKAMLEKAAAVLEDSDAYVAATIEGLADVKADAQAVYDNDDAVQNEVNAAVRTLTLKLAEARLLGDVDNDGAVTTADSTALLAASAELTELDADAAAAADVNGDGVADTGDAALILEYAAEKVAGF